MTLRETVAAAIEKGVGFDWPSGEIADAALEAIRAAWRPIAFVVGINAIWLCVIYFVELAP